MSRYLLVALCSLSSATVAQAQSFITPGVTWVIDPFVSPFLPSVAPSFYQVADDTVVAGETYRRVFRSGTGPGADAEPTGIAIREDDGGRVYMSRGDRSGLVYDFGLEVGDSIRPFNPLHPSSACAFEIVATGDTLLSDGIARRTYHLSPSGDQTRSTTVIEGVGSGLHGLFGPVCDGDEGLTSDLLCYLSPDGSTVVPSIGRCIYYDTDGVGELREALADEVYPNPFRDHVTADLPEVEGGRIELLDALGKVVYVAEGVSGRESIPTVGFVSGVYTLVATRQDGSRVAVRLFRR